MSWDISIVDPKTGETLKANIVHGLRGGTYAIEGTDELTLNVTYNYSNIWVDPNNETVGEILKNLDGKEVKRTIGTLGITYMNLEGPASEDYWEACPGNARRAIADLIELAQFAEEDSIWKVE